MCLIGFAWQAHPAFSLVVAANRDEYHARPTAASAWWQEANQVFGGRDLESGGTWMGVTRQGRFAALTNFRDPAEFTTTAPSRGALVADFLSGSAAAPAYFSERMASAHRYRGFNLLAGTPDAMCYGGNRGMPPQTLPPGIYGLSNALLDTPWPKVMALKLALGAALGRYTAAEPHVPRVSGILPRQTDTQKKCELPEPTHEPRRRVAKGGDTARDAATAGLFDSLFVALGDARPSPDNALPSTGVGLDRERLLSSAKIVAPVYGTRTATVMCITRIGRVHWEERSFTPDGRVARTVEESFNLA